MIENAGISEQDMIHREKWDIKTKTELQLERARIEKDLDLIEKRLDQLRGTTRLNQDQYREKEILDGLANRKRRDLALLNKLIENSAVAPDFRLPGTNGRSVSLNDFREKQRVLLLFYPFDFSPHCAAELERLNEKMRIFIDGNIAVLGISADHTFSQKAFSDKLGLVFPLLSDREKSVIKAYGVYDEENDAARRGYFLIGKEGKILWQQIMGSSEETLDIDSLLKTVESDLP
jgi:peroxiredoxin